MIEALPMGALVLVAAAIFVAAVGHRRPRDVEGTVILDRDTVVVKGRNRVESGEIKAGNLVVVVGAPNDRGQIKARLIRVFDRPVRKEMMWPPIDQGLWPLLRG